MILFIIISENLRNCPSVVLSVRLIIYLFIKRTLRVKLKMPKGETPLSSKNRLGLTLPEVPKDSNEQNHSENR